MDFVTIPTAGNATDFGNLTQVKFGPASAGSKTRAVFMTGGTPSRLNEVDFVTDVLVNKDLNLDPLLIVESSEESRSAPLASSTIIMINLNPDLDTEQKKEVGQKIRVLADSHNSGSGSNIEA